MFQSVPFPGRNQTHEWSSMVVSPSKYISSHWALAHRASANPREKGQATRSTIGTQGNLVLVLSDIETGSREKN